MGQQPSCLCADDNDYQQLHGINEDPCLLKNAHQIVNFVLDTEATSDETITGNTTEINDKSDVNTTRDDKIELLMTCVGWEVLIDGLGFGRLVQCVGQVESELHFLAQLQDGRKYIVPVLIEPSQEQRDLQPETRLIQRVITV